MNRFFNLKDYNKCKPSIREGKEKQQEENLKRITRRAENFNELFLVALAEVCTRPLIQDPMNVRVLRL